MSKKYIKIRNLDCAAFLHSQGFSSKKAQKLGLNDSVWFFESSEDLQDLIQDFLLGNVMVNLTNYIYHRSILKSFSRKEPLQLNYKLSKLVYPGGHYYYVDGKSVIHATYAECSPHIERLTTGNFYRDQETAKKNIKDE